MTRRLLQFCIALLIAYAALAAIAGALALRDAWRRPHWRVPVEVGTRAYSLPVANALRIATSPLGARLIDGRRFATRAGTLHTRWDGVAHALVVECAPCRLADPALGPRPLEFERVLATVQREGDALRGRIDIGRVRVQFDGRLGDDALSVQFELPRTQATDVLAALARSVPEAARARVQGTVALTGRARWPDGGWRIEPAVEGLRVAGLGTARLRGAIAEHGCGAAPPHTRGPAWRMLRAAVIAAEDQRYYEHPGYDLVEIAAALDANATADGIERGASTITQQLARIVYTGGERDAVRKLRELLYAAEMEDTLGKARILDLYLTLAPWGNGACGAEAAARTAFHRPLATLEVREIAELAAGLRGAGAERDVARVVGILRAMRGVPREPRLAAIAAVCAGNADEGACASPVRRGRTPPGPRMLDPCAPEQGFGTLPAELPGAASGLCRYARN